jgi:hypothetical protein
VSEKSQNDGQHWLYRRQNHKKLWWLFGIVLAATVVVQVAVHVHGHFGFDEWFGFNALYGFFSCALMVVFAKVLGFLLKRPEDYYDRDV